MVFANVGKCQHVRAHTQSTFGSSFKWTRGTPAQCVMAPKRKISEAAQPAAKSRKTERKIVAVAAGACAGSFRCFAFHKK